MTLSYGDLLRLSRIEEALRKSDPELARTLAAPLGPRRPRRKILEYVTLSVCAVLSLTGLVIGDITTFAAGGLALLTLYPLLLVTRSTRASGSGGGGASGGPTA